MPARRTIVTEEEPMALTDLLRTGETSRLRRRGAVHRSGHRNESGESEELTIPPNRWPRVESEIQPPLDDVYLELHCGVRTEESYFSASSSSSSPLPRPQPTRPLSPVGFIFASTGCGAQVCPRASPRQLGCANVHQVYTSTDVGPDVRSLSPKYLDSVQRSTAQFVAREGCACECGWEPLGCIVCGNPLGILFFPCDARHSLGHSGPCASYVFFTSSVTPSPAFAFHPDLTPHSNLPTLASPFETDDRSDSPASSPQARIVQMTSNSTWFTSPYPSQAPAQDDTRSWASWDPHPATIPNAPSSPTQTRDPSWATWVPNPDLIPSAPSSPSSPTPMAISALAGVPDDMSYSHVNGRSSEGQAPNTLTPPIPDMGRSVTSGRTNQQDDIAWGVYLERDRTEPAPGNDEWVPRQDRERPPGALIPGERVLDRLAALARLEPSEQNVLSPYSETRLLPT